MTLNGIEIKTTNINEAITALKTTNCITLDGSNAGWGDIELLSIIKCIREGYCTKLVNLILNNNNFSIDAMNLLCMAIGPRAGPALANSAATIAENDTDNDPE